MYIIALHLLMRFANNLFTHIRADILNLKFLYFYIHYYRVNLNKYKQSYIQLYMQV